MKYYNIFQIFIVRNFTIIMFTLRHVTQMKRIFSAIKIELIR